jgi:hypothetical protein
MHRVLVAQALILQLLNLGAFDVAGKAEGKNRRKILEARGGIEPPIKVLQTFALPLGDRAPSGRSRLRGPEPRPHEKGAPAQNQ